MQNVYVYTKDDRKLFPPKDKNIIRVSPKNNLYRKDLELEENDIFVSYEHSSPLDFRLDNYNIPYNSLVITTENIDLAEVLSDKNEEENYLEDYRIFSGQKIEVMKKDTKIAIVKSMKLLSDVMYQMLEAGYLEKKNYKKIDDWIISYEEPLLKLIKVYHKITTSNPSIDFEEEYLINPQFREMNLLIIMKILSNFMVNNNIISLEEVAKLGSWEEKGVWKKLRKKVKLLAEKK
jgi:hypothetical protein